MPLFEVEVWRKVTQRADVEIEAASEEEAREQIETALAGEGDVDCDFDWEVCDSQDDGTVMGVKEIPNPPKEAQEG